MYDRELLLALVFTDQPQKSDAIILLEGDGLYRVAEAAALFHQKFANRIVVSGGVDNKKNGSFRSEQMIHALTQMKVPVKNIIIENVSINTHEQAKEILRLSLAHRWKKIILVASHYHQPRAFLTFLKTFSASTKSPHIINAPAAHLSWFKKIPWGTRSELFKNELAKIRSYQKKGDVASFEEGIAYFSKRV